MPTFIQFKDGQLKQGNPSMLSTVLSIQRWSTYTAEPVYFSTFVPFKDNKLTQGNPSMFSTFRSIQRRPTYRRKPVYVVHLSFHSKMANLHRGTRLFCPLSLHSKTANLHRETRLCCPLFVPFKEGQITQRNPSILSTLDSIQRHPT